jgi:hypothetical protein
MNEKNPDRSKSNVKENHDGIPCNLGGIRQAFQRQETDTLTEKQNQS